MKMSTVNESKKTHRIPLEETDVLIVGSGFGGIAMGIRLKEIGHDSFIILEKESSVGGTWRDNIYPGAACDVPSHLYSFSFAPKYDWSRKYAPQSEILDYMISVVKKYQLEGSIRYRQEVVRAEFDEASGRWVVLTRQGKTFRSRFLINATGGLSIPALPEISGLNNFRGPFFHSARWKKGFSLKGKRIAVIGTGASAIQIVPAIAPDAKSVLLFQRTPPWIISRDDKPIGEMTQSLFKAIPLLRWLYRKFIYISLEWRVIGLSIFPSLMKSYQKVAVNFIRESVDDISLQKIVTPNYTIGCKRILLSNDYYPSLQRKNVSLITDSISKIQGNGIRTRDNRLYPVDAIVFATGFQVFDSVIPYPVYGLNGKNLRDVWKEGAEAYLGTAVSGFPNYFMVVGPNTGLGHNSMILMIESQARYIQKCISHVLSKDIVSVDVKKVVQEKYNRRLQKRLRRTIWTLGGCKSWYKNADGKNTTLWPGFTFSFRLMTLYPKWKNFEIKKSNSKKQDKELKRIPASENAQPAHR